MKKFKLNTDYEASLKGEVLFKGSPVPRNGENVLIDIGNLVFKFDRTWFGLICHYEVDLPFEQLMKIRFHSCSSKVVRLRSGQMPTFTSPQVFKDGFYIIPGFFDFAINKAGQVQSRRFGRFMTERINPYGYPCINIYDPDKGVWRGVCIHILLARTFIPNDSFEEKPYVNHKDGIKTNKSLRNLEWVSGSQNSRHAIKSGLRKDNQTCFVRDLQTLKEYSFNSISEAFDYFGLYKNTLKTIKRDGKIIILPVNKIYEFKLNKDEEWNFDAPLKKPVRLLGPYESRNTFTNEIEIFSSVEEMIVRFNLSKTKLTNCIYSMGIKSIRGFCFRTKSEDPWPTDIVEVKETVPKRFSLENLITGETVIIESRKKATKFLNIDKKTLFSRVEKKEPEKGWKISLLS